MDTFDKDTRSKIMRAVKSIGNVSTEVAVAKLLRLNNLTGWRRNFKIEGKPDFVYPTKKIAIFADGCFWHGCNCRKNKPASNTEYWENKIQKNIARDKKVNR